MGFRKRWKKVGKFPESGDIIRMEYFRKNPEKESLPGGCLGEERIMKFYRCKKCGKAVTVLGESGEDMFCKNAEIEELIPNTTDAAGEKHVPVITKDGSKVHVEVGSVEHPMLDNHYITWIVLETKTGSQQVDLKPGMKPVADFVLAEGDEVVAAYEYCNLHGLWRGE